MTAEEWIIIMQKEIEVEGRSLLPALSRIADLIVDQDKEIISKIEEMIKGLIGKSTHGSCCTCSGCKHYYEDDDCTCKEIAALTELLNWLKEK